MPLVVQLWDSNPQRCERIVDLTRECGCDPDVVDVSQLERAPSPDRADAIVLIGLTPAEASTWLEIVRALKRDRLEVLIYGPGWDGASLRIRSQALLSGATCVLDSAAAHFESEFRRRVHAAVSAASHRDDEQRRLHDLMVKIGIVGRSPVMLRLVRWLVRISPLSDLPVLISGETGTGKELIARAIHVLDQKRGRGPFVPLNCAALSPALAESELFGHRQGAFTGAARERLGLVRSANGGVLFLDEIGDLDVGLQGKLLRVLQENRVLGVGADREEAVSVRVIAASNRDLQEMVDERRFRADLFYRLNVLSARAPALSERREDIPLLVAHFLDRHRGGYVVTPGSTFLEALAEVELAGNVRQLENLVRRAVAQATGDGLLGLEDLPAEVWERLSRARENGPDAPGSATPTRFPDAASPPVDANTWPAVLDANDWNLTRSLRACERILLQIALSRTHGNQSKTARLLGVTPRSIYTKLRRHRLAG